MFTSYGVWAVAVVIFLIIAVLVGYKLIWSLATRKQRSAQILSAPRRYQVFVSSTSNDLADERSELLRNLSAAGYFTSGMEQFPSIARQKLKFIQDQIDISDYVVVISKGSYGTIISERGISYTEYEYDYALNKNKCVLAFVHESAADMVAQGRGDELPDGVLLGKFQKKLMDSPYAFKKWRETSDLVLAVREALVTPDNMHSVLGWVRIDQVSHTAIEQEQVALNKKFREQNFSLWARLNEIRVNAREFNRRLPKPNSIAPPDISGVWQARAKFVRMQLHQRDGEVFSTFNTGSFTHLMRGFFVGDVLTYEIWRVNNQNNELTILMGKILDIRSDKFTSITYATDCQGELEADFFDPQEWFRVQ